MPSKQVIDWDVLNANLQAIAPNSGATWIESTLAIINTGYVTQDQAALLLSGADLRPTVITDSLRDKFAGWLRLIIEHGSRGRLILAGETSHHMRGIICRPSIVVGRARNRLDYGILCRDLHAAVSYAIFLLLNDEINLGKRLAECHHCGNFFLVAVRAKGGRTRRRYCSKECMDAADRAGAAERVAASREGVPVGQWRARQRARLKRRASK